MISETLKTSRQSGKFTDKSSRLCFDFITTATFIRFATEGNNEIITVINFLSLVDAFVLIDLISHRKWGAFDCHENVVMFDI